MKGVGLQEEEDKNSHEKQLEEELEDGPSKQEE